MTSPSRKIVRRPQKGGIISTLIGLLFLVLLCGAMYLARVPLLRLAAESWIVDEPVDHADVIIVLSDDNFYADRVTRELHGGDLERDLKIHRRLRLLRRSKPHRDYS